jgi:hypothetical protein
MTTVSSASAEAQASPRNRVRERSLFDRLVAATPILLLAIVILGFYAIEALSRKTPWVFTDELEWTQLSRSIAHTGHAARRTDPIYFKSIYAYVIAPFWWLHTTITGYKAVKYANVVIMTSAAIPTYLLARMLVTKRTAVIVAVLTVSVPAMAYVTSIIPEVIAYPYFALCSWLSVRAFTSGRRRDYLLAILFVLGAYFVRQQQFTSLPVAFAAAAAGLWITGAHGKELRRNWSRGDTIGAAFLVLGGLFLANRIVLQHIPEWQQPTQYAKRLMIDLGLRAGLSFTIGMGVLPVIGGLTSLRLPERRGDPTYRAYVAWTCAAIAFVVVYTSDKAAYLSMNFSTLWEERDMIYLAPLLLLGTAMVFEAKKIDLRVFTASSALVLIMILLKPIQLGYPYFEALGSEIAARLYWNHHWSVHDLRLGLVFLFVISVLLILFRRVRFVPIVTVALLGAWLVSAELAATAGIDALADAFRHNLPAQLNWVDRATGGKPVTYLGTEILDPNGVNLTEFWNSSIDHVESLDGTAPGPGPTPIPNILTPTGRLGGYGTYPYVLADNGVKLDASAVAKNGDMVLYRKSGPWRLVDNTQQVYSDGWCPDWCSYTYFKPSGPGTLEVGLSRAGYNGPTPPALVTLRAGTVRIDRNDSAQLKKVKRVLFRVVPNLKSMVVRIPVSGAPVRVEVRTADKTLIQRTPSDSRTLGVQVSFAFVPRKG